MNNYINIYPINSLYFNINGNAEIFIDTIYKNFLYLSNYKKLNHNKLEIKRLLFSPNFRGYLVKDKHKVIGYLLGEIIDNGFRKIFFISYLYILELYRNKGIASKLLDLIIIYSNSLDLDSIMLICDTKNLQIYNFYLKRKFMLDMYMKRFDRYDVLSLKLN